MTAAIVNSMTRSYSWFLVWGISAFAALTIARVLIEDSTRAKLAERRADPEIAVAFARWWLHTALDYSQSNAAISQQSASKWMDKAAASSFSQTFWSNGKGVGQKIVFIPTYYSDPVYVDGRTICVSVSGEFVSLAHPVLASHFVKIDLTVRPDADGWRVGAWKLAYDPDCSKTIKFLSRARTGKANIDVNQKALSYFGKAADLELSHNMLSATEAYNQSIKLNPQFACAYLNRGRIWFELKHYEFALKDYSKAIELDPTLWLAYFNRGLVRTFVKGSTAVLADYDEAIRLCPRFPYTYNDRAIERADHGDRQGALADYTMAVELAPMDGFSHASRANLRIQMNDYDGALADANEAVRLGAASSYSYRTRGNVWFAMKNYLQAQKDFKQAELLEDWYQRRN